MTCEDWCMWRRVPRDSKKAVISVGRCQWWRLRSWLKPQLRRNWLRWAEFGVFAYVIANLVYQWFVSVMESSRTCPWPRGSSRTISIVLGLGLGLVSYVLGLGLVDKVLEFTKDTYTSSADALNVQQNCRTNSTNSMKYFGLLTMCHDNNFNLYI